MNFNYKKRLIVICFFISLTVYYIFDDIVYVHRLIEKYGDTPSSLNLGSYRADIEAKPLAGVKSNLSGLSWSEKHGLLFAVINNPSEVVWLTSEGDLAGGLLLSEIADPEAIVWAGEDQFWIGSEKDNIAWLVNIDTITGSYNILYKIRHDEYSRPGNKGLEGLAWDRKGQQLFSAKEKKPVMITRESITEKDKVSYRYPSAVTASVKDVSGLHYHALTSSLLVLSDESKKILEINSEGQVIDRLYLSRKWSGLKEDIPQAEGITLDSRGNLYIVSEPNLFFRFVKGSHLVSR